MNISNLSNASSLLFDQSTNGDVGIAVLKKALDTQAQGAAALINALPKNDQTSSSSLPSHLGQNVNTTA